MRKKYLSALLFGALLFASAGTFQSCKDYDDDIDNLKEQLDQKASLEDLNAKVEQLNTAVSEAKTTAQEALDKAQEALDKANQGGTEGVSEDEMNAAIEAAKAEIEKEMEKLAKLEDVEAKIKAMQETLDATVGATEEQLQNLQTQVEALTVQVMNVIGSRLTSVTLIPEMHINGIPAITFTTLQITGLRKDGQNIDLSTLNYTTDANDWNEGTDRVEVDGGEAIKNDKDLVFAMLPDAKDNTSYNLVWAMNPETVGKLAGSNGKYASTYEIDVEYIDPAGLNGNIKQTFKQTIEAPTQEFSYQGTYWADGKGEGVFNVNPIVFNTNNDGWAGTEQSHVYPGATNGCELQDYSHIEADLVNGYIYEPTKQKPTSVAQFIQKIRNCADVKFVFDKDKFANYDYLAGYTTDAEGTQLWKGSVGTAVDNDQTPNNNINESDMGIYDYVQDDNLAATINNFMGATETENKKNLPWDLNETLGTGEDECKAIIRLHEKDGLNGTAAANALVGKKVPVKLVVAYNDYNVVPVQEFEVMFITPLTIDGTIGDNFVDAMVDGSFLSVAENFTFTDWNGYKVARVTPTTPASEKESYAHQLYDYYAVNEVTFLTDQTTTSLAYDAATNTYIHKDGVTDGKLPTGRSLKQMNWDESQPKSTATETSADPTHLAYFNNSGTPVNVDYEMFVDVTVKYKWGNLPKNDIKVKVSKAEGIE